MGYRHGEVFGVFYLPPEVEPGRTDAERTRSLANSVAALTELYHFSLPETTFTAHYGKDEDVQDDAPPFQGWWVLPAAADTEKRAADFLFSEVTTSLARRGADVAEASTAVSVAPGAPIPRSLVGTFGITRLCWPRRRVVKQAALALSARLVQSWVAPRAGTLEEQVREWLTAQWAKEELGAEHLIERLERAGERVLGEKPLDTFREWIDTVSAANAIEPAMVLRLQERIGDLVGGVTATPSLSNAAGAALDGELDRATGAWAAEWEQKWLRLVWSLVDQRLFRFAGAEAASRQAAAAVRESLAHHVALAQDLAAKAAQVEQALVPILAELRSNPRSRRRVSELRDALRRQVEGLYRRKLLGRVLRGFGDLPELLSNRERELTAARADLGKVFADADPQAAEVDDPLAGRLGVAAAVEEFLARLTPADLDELDRDMESMIGKQYQSLAQLCLVTSWKNRYPLLARSMRHQAAVFVQDRVGFPDVLAKWLAGDDARRPLTEAFERANSRLGPVVEAAPRLTVLALPASTKRGAFRDMACSSLPSLQLVDATSLNDVTLFVEQESSAAAALAYLGDTAERAYYEAGEQRHLTPHARLDITAWREVPTPE
jgi:hypothetical protein